ncbi:hypothetical protein KBD59_03435 [Candidatus Gracilibacteria bacterium]|nr:hypothetical protein [Candidatus Gracilibacteria bacterium]
MPVADNQQTLYLVLSISVAILTIVLSVAIIYLIFILRDSSKVVERVRETVDRVNNMIIKPVTLVGSIVDHVRPLIESAINRVGRSQEKKHSKKK